MSSSIHSRTMSSPLRDRHTPSMVRQLARRAAFCCRGGYPTCRCRCTVETPSRNDGAPARRPRRRRAGLLAGLGMLGAFSTRARARWLLRARARRGNRRRAPLYERCPGLAAPGLPLDPCRHRGLGAMHRGACGLGSRGLRLLDRGRARRPRAAARGRPGAHGYTAAIDRGPRGRIFIVPGWLTSATASSGRARYKGPSASLAPSTAVHEARDVEPTNFRLRGGTNG